MLKKLHIKLTKVDRAGVLLKITEQSHIGDTFGSIGNRYISAHQVRLSSQLYPSYMDVDHVCVRGNDTRHHNDTIKIPVCYFENILKAILEYNQAYNMNNIEMSDVVEGLSRWEKYNA